MPSTVQRTCVECTQSFEASGIEVRKGNAKFCSHSCSASHNNRIRVRARKFKKCRDCDKQTATTKSKLCVDCGPRRPSKRKAPLEQRTLEDLRESYSLNDFHAKIRGDSRQAFRASGRPYTCLICGYRKHVDICHVIPLKDFPNSATLGEVNSSDNLIALCKNHHWEFDHDELDPEDQVELLSSRSG